MEKKYSWIETNDKRGFILIEETEKFILGYVIHRPSLKVRIVENQHYGKIEELKDTDLRQNFWERHAVEGIFGTVGEAKKAIEAQLNIIQIDNPSDVLAFLAKIKDFEVHGKIEVVIRIEGWNPPVKEGK
jgi:hypothetical protein